MQPLIINPSQSTQAEIIGPADKSVSVVAAPHPFSTETQDFKIPAGLTLTEILEEVQTDPILRRHAHIFIDDDLIPKENWHLVRPKPGTNVTIRVIPGKGGSGEGGKDPLRIILMIAIIAIAILLPPLLGFAAGTIGAALISAAVLTVGNLLIDVIAPPPKPKLGNLASGLGGGSALADSPTLFLQGTRNELRPFGAVPRLLGRHGIIPPLGARPFTEIVGDDQYLRMLFVWGQGPLTITNMKIGETDISTFNDVQIETVEGLPGDPAMTLFPNDIFEETLSIALTVADGVQIRTSQANADELSVDITLPQGLVEFTPGGGKGSRTVNIKVEYHISGSMDALTLAGNINITASKSTAIRQGLRWQVATDQYDVHLTRTTADTTSVQVFDLTNWTALRTITNIDPVNMPGIAKTALRIKATGQLNGIIDQLGATVEARIPDWDEPTLSWITRATSNPASIFREVLQGPGNARPIADNRVDLESLKDWHGFCVTNGFEFNMNRDFVNSVQDTLRDVASSGRASLNIRNGKWGVAIDRVQTTIVQHFTPRNSKEFNGKKLFIDQPHAFRVRFSNRDENWDLDERLVFDDGFDAMNATKFEVLEMVGITDKDQVWKDGRFHIAQARLRPESYSFTTDIEYLVCQRGSLIRFQHDVPLFGIASGRIKVVNTGGGNVTGVVLDERVAHDVVKTYSLRIRNTDDGSSRVDAVSGTPDADGLTDTLTYDTPFPVAQTPLVGDLVQYGETGVESVELIVKSIEPRPDLTARLVCMDAAPAVHTADSGPIPSHSSQITPPPGSTVPQVVSVRSDETVLVRSPDGSLQARVVISLAMTARNLDRVSKIESQYRPTGSAGSWISIPDVPADAPEIIITGIDQGDVLDIRCRFLFLDGTVSNTWAQINGHTVVGKSSRPPNLTTFTFQRLPDGTRRYDWTDVDKPLDNRGYQIRYQSGSSFDWDTATPLHIGFLTSSPFESNELSAGTWSIGIKAIDTSDNESLNAVFATATIGDPRLQNALLSRIEENLTWPGTLTDCFIGPENTLLATSSGDIDSLPATIDNLPSTINLIATNNSPIRYETPTIDLGADITFTPVVATTQTGTPTIEMRTHTSAEGSDLSSETWIALTQVVQERYIEIRVSVADSAAELKTMSTILDGEVVIDSFEDLDPSTESAIWFESVAAGHFKVATRDKMAVITTAQITAIQGVTVPHTWTLVSKSATVTGNSNAAAEFKIFDDVGTLVDVLVDIELKGPIK